MNGNNESPSARPQGPKKVYDREIGETVDQFATRLLALLRREPEISVKFGGAVQIVPQGATVETIREFDRVASLPQPKRTPSGIEILSPAIGSNPYEFIKSTFERAMRDNTPVALEISDITFVIDPVKRRVTFDRVNYHLDSKRPITLDDVMKYLESVKSFRGKY